MRLLPCFTLLLLLCSSRLLVATGEEPRPNILWITSEDHGIEMGCYGDQQATTPNVDSLAARGMRYRFVWSCAPVCAPARTTLITGKYATSLGAEHMRSMVTLPADIHLFPRLLRNAGYYCSNRSKEDYNVREADDKPAWNASNNKAHWRQRDANQPFFAVFNSTRSHESSIRDFKGEPKHSPDQIRVPRYHPDTPEVRRDWAIYYDSVTQADEDAGKVLQQLEADGLSESTIVFYFGDHGSGMPRRKRWAGNSGLRVPLIVYIPERYKHLRPDDYVAGGESTRLVSFADFAPTVLNLADVEVPKWMDGAPFLGREIAPKPTFVFGFRGRMDERSDLVRSVSNGRFVYIRNFMTHVSAAQHVAYQFETPTTAHWKQLFDEGKCNAAQSAFWTTPRPVEELYDLSRDPDEVHNVIDDPEHQAILFALKSSLFAELERCRDLGAVPEGLRPSDTSRNSNEISLKDLDTPQQIRYWVSAWRASMRTSGLANADEPKESGLLSAEPVVRYWAAMAFVTELEELSETNCSLLQKVSQSDPSHLVQVVACHALSKSVDNERKQTALRQLITLVENNDDWFVAMHALETLDQLDSSKWESSEMVRIKDAMKRAGEIAPPHARYDSYVPRLVESLSSKLNR